MKIFAAYLILNLVFAAAVLLLILISPVWSRWRAGTQLRLHYAILALSLALPAITFFNSGGMKVKPVVEVWSPSVNPSRDALIRKHDVLLMRDRTLPVAADLFFLFTVGIGFGAGLTGAWYLLRGQRRLAIILRESFLLKKIGRVRVLVSADVRIPFSYWSPAAAYVVVPQYLISSSLRLAVAHELQHHRQRDTVWAYALTLSRAVCFFNPCVHLWHRWIGETQEFACDEALVGRQRSRARDYARCLIEVAETAWVFEGVPEGATGMILLNRGKLLNRRIKFMFKERKKTGKLATIAAFALVATGLAGTAYAAKGLVQDRRVTMAQAQVMASRVAKDSVFPVVVNDEVLRHLNYYVGTVEGRTRMRTALRRMQNYRVMVESKIAEYQAPPELMAIPLIESGYQNLADRQVEGWGAGLWMFIESTARAYGLKVNAQNDQRMNEELLTDAAMRYLTANRLRFKDWHLSALAYNAGEGAIQQEIFRTGSRDPWVLVRAEGLSYESRQYLPKLIAAILIMKNPDAVE